MADATIVVESARKGGGLITCHLAQDYGRSVFAFPGAVGMAYSEGCNQLIRDNGAALITSAQDFVEEMRWSERGKMEEVRGKMVEGELFVELTEEEEQVVTVLRKTNDLQLNMIAVQTNIPIGQLTALLFSLEMKGVVRPLAGCVYHLLS
jgi:DNA processing protein